jgi:hypothetical protein
MNLTTEQMQKILDEIALQIAWHQARQLTEQAIQKAKQTNETKNNSV